MTVPDDTARGAAEWIVQILAGMPKPREEYSRQSLKEVDLRCLFLDRKDFESEDFDEGLRYALSRNWVQRLQQKIVLTKDGWNVLPKPYNLGDRRY
jgi:hypothetical protein